MSVLPYKGRREGKEPRWWGGRSGSSLQEACQAIALCGPDRMSAEWNHMPS